MVDHRRPPPGIEHDVDLGDWLVLGLLVGGLVLLTAPLALQAFAVLTLVATLGAIKLSDWMARRLPEDVGGGGRPQ